MPSLKILNLAQKHTLQYYGDSLLLSSGKAMVSVYYSACNRNDTLSAKFVLHLLGNICIFNNYLISIQLISILFYDMIVKSEIFFKKSLYFCLFLGHEDIIDKSKNSAAQSNHCKCGNQTPQRIGFGKIPDRQNADEHTQHNACRDNIEGNRPH